MKPAIALAALMLGSMSVGACATVGDNGLPKGSALPPPVDAGLSDEQEARYQDCLEQSQAVAMAWEEIQRQCRERAVTESGTLE